MSAAGLIAWRLGAPLTLDTLVLCVDTLDETEVWIPLHVYAKHLRYALSPTLATLDPPELERLFSDLRRVFGDPSVGG